MATRKLPTALYRRGAAGYGLDKETEKFLDARDELWSAKSSGMDPRWSDDDGHLRGALGFTDDDPGFRSPRYQGENTVTRTVDSPLGQQGLDWTAGETDDPKFRETIGGSGGLPKGGSPRYEPKTGPRANASGTDRKGRR